jgi:peroxin-19
MADKKSLDDILEAALADFDDDEPATTSSAASAAVNAPSSSSSGMSSHAGTSGPAGFSMSDILGGAGTGAAGGEDPFNDTDLDAFASQFKSVIDNFLRADPNAAAGAEGGADLSDSSAAIDASIRAAFEQLHTAPGGLDGAGGDMSPEAMMAQLQQLESDPRFAGLLGTMMQQLLSKDVLYGPMSELRDRFPPWLAEHQHELSAEEVETYRQQIRGIEEVVALYECDAPSERVVEAMTRLQSLGQPPKELLDSFQGSGQGPAEPQFNEDACKLQ